MTKLQQMRAHMHPRRSQQVQARKVGRDTLIVHLPLKQYHVLNHIAGRIWDLADGARSAEDIATAIAGEFVVDRVTADADVLDTLQTLLDLRLVEVEAAS
jgi:pyrroloquinoline quinone biosynthesis protein D